MLVYTRTETMKHYKLGNWNKLNPKLSFKSFKQKHALLYWWYGFYPIEESYSVPDGNVWCDQIFSQ